jgi:hypothetical protein
MLSEAGDVAQWYRVCSTCTRSCVPSLAPTKQKQIYYMIRTFQVHYNLRGPLLYIHCVTVYHCVSLCVIVVQKTNVMPRVDTNRDEHITKITAINK